MTNDEKKFLAEFEYLRTNAENKKDLDLSNMVDYHYFATLKAIYQLKRLGSVPEEKINKHLVQLKSNYVTDKGIFLRDRQNSEDDLHRRMTCSELLSKLNRSADEMSTSEIFEVFSGIIENGFDKISGEKIREKLLKRPGKNTVLICQDEGEGYISDLLLILRVKNDKVSEVITRAKTVGECVEDSFKIKYEGGRFALYKI